MNYDPIFAYGAKKQLAVNQSLKFRKEFTGKEFDDDGASGDLDNGMNLYYFGARYYDPDIIMWTSPDPMDEFWNSYSYVGMNPINLIDPDGLETAEADKKDPDDNPPPVDILDVINPPETEESEDSGEETTDATENPETNEENQNENQDQDDKPMTKHEAYEQYVESEKENTVYEKAPEDDLHTVRVTAPDAASRGGKAVSHLARSYKAKKQALKSGNPVIVRTPIGDTAVRETVSTNPEMAD